MTELSKELKLKFESLFLALPASSDVDKIETGLLKNAEEVLKATHKCKIDEMIGSFVGLGEIKETLGGYLADREDILGGPKLEEIGHKFDEFYGQLVQEVSEALRSKCGCKLS